MTHTWREGRQAQRGSDGSVSPLHGVVLKNAPILVLDEATSALDSEVEASIQEHLLDLMNGKTVIAVAHRLSTIACLDRLLVLNDGRIVEARYTRGAPATQWPVRHALATSVRRVPVIQFMIFHELRGPVLDRKC